MHTPLGIAAVFKNSPEDIFEKRFWFHWAVVEQVRKVGINY